MATFWVFRNITWIYLDEKIYYIAEVQMLVGRNVWVQQNQFSPDFCFSFHPLNVKPVKFFFVGLILWGNPWLL